MYFEIEAFKTQHDTIMLLLLSGIGPLPNELVYSILRDYVYVKPIRIGLECFGAYPCQHKVNGIYFYTHDITKWFIKHGIDVPKHFELFKSRFIGELGLRGHGKWIL